MGSKVKLEDEAGNVGQLKIVSPLKDEITGNEISFYIAVWQDVVIKEGRRPGPPRRIRWD